MIFCSLGSYSFCNQFIVTPVVVQGKSMLPTLREGEFYLLNRWSYRHREPKRGELVVLRDPGHSDYAVKRLIGLPGENIRLSEGQVLVNNKPLQEPYLTPKLKTFAPHGREQRIALGKDEYYVLGDNRLVSEDSRYYGPISRRQLAGNIYLR